MMFCRNYVDNHEMSDNPYLIHEAVRDNKPLMVENLLMESPKLLIKPDDDERTPIHWAASGGNENMVDLLIKYFPQVKFDIDDLVDASGWTPIHIAVSIGNLAILRKLIELASETPDVNLQTNQGTTALDLAISKERNDVARYLIEELNCSCRLKDKKGFTPLHRASCNNNLAIIDVLLSKGKVNVNATDRDGWTSLHHALAEGNVEIAVKLARAGADVNARNSDGETPLQVAVDDKAAKSFAVAVKP